MTGKKSTKRALLLSALSLLMCFSMLIGSTYAWFTDSVTSGNNIIKSGTLKVSMEWADGDTDPATTDTWADASQGAIFDYDLWEPGYVESRHLRISNIGNLAFNYRLRIVANGAVGKLADVIDVYYFEDAKQLIRADVETGKYLGTVAEVLGTGKNISNSVFGMLEADEAKEITLALKMRESAGNEYQGLSIGTDFSIELIATQASFEPDSFGKDYDEEVSLPDIPAALVRPMNDLGIDTTGSKFGMDLGMIDLDVGYSFEPTDSLEDALKSDYRYWHADFVVSADNNVAANSLALAGYYDAWCSLNNDKWVALTSPDVITAGTEIRLVSSMISGFTVNWEELCQYGNDGIGFRCGAVDLDGSNEGTTLKVELRLYETEEPSESNGNSHNKETGKYITLGVFEHTFGGEYKTLDDGSVLFYAKDGDVVLYDTQNVNATDYTVPQGVTQLGNYSFTYGTIENVTLSSDVRDLGRAFDSSSSVRKVVLNEGLTVISSRAFKATSNLEEVVIPSTVTVIEDNAFQKSGIRTITIPASVETVGETAFGASKIETVTFEGNTAIQGYAFRACPNLRTVNLNGDDVTFVKSTLNGRESMWFTNGESGNPGTNSITFNVKNTTVADRIVSIMGVGSDFYINVESGETYATVSGQEEMKEYLANGTDVLLLMKGTYDLKECQKAGVSFFGLEQPVKMENTTDFAGNGKLGAIWQTMTISNVTFTDTVYTMADGGQSTFNNVTFEKGVRCAYGSAVTFNNCKFGSNSEGYALHFESDASSEGGVITLNSCEFKGGKVHLGSKRSYEFTDCIFASGTDFQVWSNISLKNCTVGGVVVTAENVSTLFPNLDMAKVTLK